MITTRLACEGTDQAAVDAAFCYKGNNRHTRHDENRFNYLEPGLDSLHTDSPIAD